MKELCKFIVKKYRDEELTRKAQQLESMEANKKNKKKKKKKNGK